VTTPRAVRTGRNWLAIALMSVGLALWATGELIGVFDPREGDTTSEAVWWLRGRFRGYAIVAIVGGMGWATWHFLVEG